MGSSHNTPLKGFGNVDGETRLPLQAVASTAAVGANTGKRVFAPITYFVSGVLAITLISKSNPASQVTPTAVQFG